MKTQIFSRPDSNSTLVRHAGQDTGVGGLVSKLAARLAHSSGSPKLGSRADQNYSWRRRYQSVYFQT